MCVLRGMIVRIGCANSINSSHLAVDLDDKPPELAPKKRIPMINRAHSSDHSPALPPKKSSVAAMFGSTGSLTDTTSSFAAGE